MAAKAVAASRVNVPLNSGCAMSRSTRLGTAVELWWSCSFLQDTLLASSSVSASACSITPSSASWAMCLRSVASSTLAADLVLIARETSGKRTKSSSTQFCAASTWASTSTLRTASRRRFCLASYTSLDPTAPLWLRKWCSAARLPSTNPLVMSNSRPSLVAMYSLSTVRKPGVLRKNPNTSLVSTPRPTDTSIASSSSSQPRRGFPSAPTSTDGSALRGCATLGAASEGNAGEAAVVTAAAAGVALGVRSV
mmetsp:Transcript_27353/g.56043  ORF Transcript_27353/g.56043 Transcript_27353/m.56043 type:complete len:252 (-) Transcript_27353:431-1186(-)